MDNDTQHPVADPFAPVSVSVATPTSPKAELWEPQIPAPGEPPAAEAISHSRFGKASRHWVYRSGEGVALFAVVRFDIEKADGARRKEMLPYTFGRRVWTTQAGNRIDKTAWHFKRPDTPIALYGLDRLASRPDGFVIVCEGEKAADAAEGLFPGSVGIASQGGSKAASRADWSPLIGRRVVIWPDNDEPGAKYADAVAHHLRAAGADNPRVVAIPGGWADGWDLADDLPAGVLPEALVGLLAAAEFAGGDEPTEEGEADQSAEMSAEEAVAEIERLSRLPSAEYARARKRSAQALLMGVGDLDKAVKGAKVKRRGEAEALHRAQGEPQPGETLWPLGVLPREDGLYFDAGGDAGPEWISSPLEVLGQGRDADGESWGLWLRWRDPDGRQHTWPMPTKLLTTQPGEMEAALMDRGLKINIDPQARAHLRCALSGVRSGSRVSFVETPGWGAPDGEHSAFVLIDGTVIGSAAEEIVLKARPENASAKMAQAGTLDGWKEAVAAKATGNPVAAFSLCAAFAGPLLEPLGEPSGGFHIHGRSKAGKTLAMRLGISVWGPPKKAGLLKDWRSTANALEGAAEECNDGFLTLDEIHQAEPKDVVGAVYQLANESGKQRLTRDAVSKRRRTWRTIVMSTGEIDIATMAAKASSTPLPAGAEVRLPSIPIDGQDMWPDLHGEVSPSALMAALQKGLLGHFGTPIRDFLPRLTEVRASNDGSLELAFKEMRNAFYESLPADADGQVKDVARRCAMIALAGELATEWEILPWQVGDATKAAKTILAWWIGRRGGVSATEESQHITAVRAYLSEHGNSRFITIDWHLEQGVPGRWIERHPDRPIQNRTGWKRPTEGDGESYEYLLDKDGWRKLCADRSVDAAETAKTLAAAAHLAKADGKNLAKKMKIPGFGEIRCYVVLPSIFTTQDSDAAVGTPGVAA